MPKFSVDVKAFIKVDVEAADAAAARTVAENFVEHLSPEAGYIGGYNEGLSVASETAKIADAGSFDIDGTSEVERICGECGEPIDRDDRSSINPGIHDFCEPPPEVPLDTPSLDTSFHDHEMDVA